MILKGLSPVQGTAYNPLVQKTALFPNLPPRLGRLLNICDHISYGVGKLKDELKLCIDKGVAPVS